MMMKIVRIWSHTVAKVEMMRDIWIILHQPQLQGAAPAGQELAYRPDMQFQRKKMVSRIFKLPFHVHYPLLPLHPLWVYLEVWQATSGQRK